MSGAKADIRVGTCSWTDKTLIDSKSFYPPEARSAADRLAHYASQFPIVEVDATYYALPSEKNAIAWVERTPGHFIFNVKAFGGLTQHPIEVSRLPGEMRHFLKGLKKKRVYAPELPEQAREMIWALFASALKPLDQAGKLGAILFQFPHWFRKNKQNVDYLREVGERCPYPVAVEFRGGGWLDEGRQDSTFAVLEELGMAYVVVDEPQGFKSSVPPVRAVTNAELAMIRFHGHNDENWEKKNIPVVERFKYLYDEKELGEWVEPVQELASQSKQLHVLFNNCYADYGVKNAAQMANLLVSTAS